MGKEEVLKAIKRKQLEENLKGDFLKYWDFNENGMLNVYLRFET